MSKSKGNVAVAAVAATAVAVAVVFPTDEVMREAGMVTLSARIRHLSGMGAKTAEIAKIVKRENGAHPLYQHVRNVLNTPLKGAGEVITQAVVEVASAETE